MRRMFWGCALFLTLNVLAARAGGVETVIPDSFPEFFVPGHQAEMDMLRQLMWLHSQPPAGPLATLWDDWMSGPTLWPALATDNAMDKMRDRWRNALSTRGMDAEGYVATHQHGSIAHQLGWPFPFWAQGGAGAWGWHFSLQGVPPAWHGTKEKNQEGWSLERASDMGIHDAAWNLSLTGPCTTVTTPPLGIDVYQAPFMQLRWKATGLGNSRPFIEWLTADASEYGPERRFYFPPIESKDFVFTMIPVFKHPDWKGKITRIRINFDNIGAGPEVGIQAFFTQYDTRHNINNTEYPAGCVDYFLWTLDINFLRENINRMRTALRYVMTEFKALDEKVVLTPWVGHEGRSGRRLNPDGSKIILPGNGIGNNYWDLLPMGYKDAYATIHYYHALQRIIDVERAINAHPEWNIPGGVLKLDPEMLEKHAAEVKRTGNRLFWNTKTKRFNCSVDIDGNSYDYGFTFLNLEAIHYNFATPRHAKDVMSWISGDRIVEGDTSQGADIYHWRFAPRATTKRNIDYYIWSWGSPEKIAWGGQVQDGGAVLGFSYHDLMARLKTRGPDDAWNRLKEIIAWFDEVQKAGGYRKYYDGTREGSLQGGGTAGGLGMDMEFFESLLVPQIMLDGFLGFHPTAEGFTLNPNLPSEWPELTVSRIYIHDRIYDIHVTPTSIQLNCDEYRKANGEDFVVTYPLGEKTDRVLPATAFTGKTITLERRPR
jgi:hypothetical protein